MTATPVPFDFGLDHGAFVAVRPRTWRRILRNPRLVAAAALLGVLLIGAILTAFVPAIERHSPTDQSLDELHAGPSYEHPFGTDNLGRDTWSRAWQGLRISLKVGIGVELLVLLVGVAIGATAALAGRFVDGVLMRFTDVMYAFPDLLAVLVLRSVLGSREWPILGTGDPQIPGLPGPMLQVILAIALVAWVTVARLVRGQVLALRDIEYVVAARALGAGPIRVFLRHLLPNVSGTLIVAAAFGIPAAIFAEATLGFIGFGLPAPNASLGTLVADGYTYFRINTWMIVVPAVAIALVMLGFTLLGDGLRDELDPRTRR